MHYKTDDGYEARLVSLEIVDWYSNALEGSPEMISRIVRAQLPHRLKGRAKAYLVLDPGESVLPWYRCIAHFKSASLHSGNFYSELVVCWFHDDIMTPVPILLTRLLASLSWSTHAQDVSFDQV